MLFLKRLIGRQRYDKETPAQVFSSEYCDFIVNIEFLKKSILKDICEQLLLIFIDSKWK